MKRSLVYVALAGATTSVATTASYEQIDAGSAMLSSSASAREASSLDKQCPDLSKLTGICDNVYGRDRDNSDPENFSYAYERKIYQASCVDFKSDTQAEARQKIQALWRNHQDRLQCDGANFPVANGSILKFAVEMQATVFVTNATRFWGLDLNIVDQSDGKTVLDYTRDRIEAYRGTPAESTLRNYYSDFRRYGAKHASELHAGPLK
ncbi:hypothetical protein [Sphingobium fuliginis]|uniref:Uncharacterized protein n=1 Tax=Sphingobium fuliginis ATCC 27551 TaxID=1208342 RepID=A0A5B8CA09_SPHSA|nr:hypothetical protein [Sphingobium fuliginis]QDC36218.1 hypothetical protein FIL70_02125 [Sphingobium fuliginis ATCC 27551]